MSSGPTPNFNLPILPISLCLSPGKLSEFSLVQTPHLCLQDSLPTSARRDILTMLISRQVVGVFTVQTPHLCLQDLLPTSACRDTPSISKTYRFRQSIDKSLPSNDLTSNIPKSETKTHHLNQEYSSSSMPLTLHQQCTNQCRLQILSISSTQT